MERTLGCVGDRGRTPRRQVVNSASFSFVNSTHVWNSTSDADFESDAPSVQEVPSSKKGGE